MTRIYVAGPYSKGDVARNVAVAIRAANSLLMAGYVPYVPHMTHFWHMLYPHSYETWLSLDFAWLDVCDAVLRLPGESEGADRECIRAGEKGIPVYTSLEPLMLWKNLLGGS